MKFTTLAVAASFATCAWNVPAYGASSAQSAPTATVQASPPSSSTAGLHLLAQFVSGNVMAGSAVILQATLSNDGTSHSVMHELGKATDDFQISVIDSQGCEIPLTAWGKDQAASRKDSLAVILMNMNRGLVPSYPITYQFVSNRQFDMSEDGVYRVVVSCQEILSGGGKISTTLVSNVADVEITEPPPEVESPEDIRHG